MEEEIEPFADSDYEPREINGKTTLQLQGEAVKYRKVEADKILANMLERETIPSEAARDRWVRTVDETRFNHRWGK